MYYEQRNINNFQRSELFTRPGFSEQTIIKFTSHKLDLYYRRMEKKDEMILKPKVKGDKGIYTNCNLT